MHNEVEFHFPFFTFHLVSLLSPKHWIWPKLATQTNQYLENDLYMNNEGKFVSRGLNKVISK